LPEDSPKRGVIKRSIVIAGHRTSVSLEQLFWQQLKQIADQRDVSLNALVQSIDRERDGENLSSAIRIFILNECLHRAGQLT
jgi:predicted DNA-binding ribbon-helix-helix protein